jgi:outer membrane protein assembly factor BamB
MQRLALAVAVCFLAAQAFGAAAQKSAATDGEWPCWRGPNHDGKPSETGLLKEWPAGGPAQLWQYSGLGKGFSSVAVSGGSVYTAGDADGKMTLFALGMDGKLKWKIPHDQAWTGNPGGSRSTPTVDGNVVYILSGHGLIGCYDARTGAKVWTRAMSELGGRPGGWGFAESVLIQGPLAIVTPGGKNCITALDKTTGKTAWSSTGFNGPAHYGSCTPFTFNNMPMLAAGTGGGLVCVDARTGAKLWSNPFCTGNTANCPTPAYADGYVFWANGYGKGGICMKLGAGGATEAWTTKEMICHHGGYVIHEGHIYGNHEGGVACLDLKTGERKWFDRAVGKCSLTWADGMLFLFGEGGGAAGLGPATPTGFKLAGRFSVKGEGPSWAHPVVAGGKLYLRYDTNLYCFDVKGK